MVAGTTTVLTGLRFGEGPRHGPDGRLWFSDFYAHQVFALDLASGERELICEVPGQPSGLGWLPDGRLLVVSMRDRKVLRREPDGTLTEHADLSAIATFHANDMLVDPAGRAYVGNFGFDLHTALDVHGVEGLMNGSVQLVPATLALVQPDGSVSAATPDLLFPNGMVLFGRTLIISETLGFRLTAFDVADDGSLSNRRIWADLQPLGIAPDGICGDAEGAIWTSSALGSSVFRVTEGGTATDEIPTGQHCFAVALTGPERRTLACITAPESNPSVVADAELGAIETVEVAVPAI
ncbi:MAG TPA: SMP-30/gluconolactonase/LRE family protein [Pseudonocardiaceae bacterium]|nr:SMP-30/gluconolactonase/LRE family protein [Pseudonocardiaceae bacterium]